MSFVPAIRQLLDGSWVVVWTAQVVAGPFATRAEAEAWIEENFDP